MTYWGRFYRTEMDPLLKSINTYLMRWARKKDKRLRAFKRLKAGWKGVTQRDSELFAHWAWTHRFHPAGWKEPCNGGLLRTVRGEPRAEMPSATRHCQDTKRRGEAEHTSFDFLGYTSRARLVRGRRGFFVSFAPAMSSTARKAKGRQIRAWHLNRRSGSDLSDLAQAINPQVRGWI